MNPALRDDELAIAPPRSMGGGFGTALLMALLFTLLVVEWMSGEAFSLHLFYLFPVALAAWNFGLRAGLAVAALAAGYCVSVALGLRVQGAAASHLFWQALSTLGLFVLAAWAVAHHRRFVDLVSAQARLDHETRALSRREFERVLESEARRARRYQRPLSLVIVDVDAVKPGEVAAKGLIRGIAECLRQHVREGDSVARIGARKLAVVLLECHAAEANRAMRRAADAIGQRFHRGLPLRFGSVCYAGAGNTSAAGLMQAAEREAGARAQSDTPPMAVIV